MYNGRMCYYLLHGVFLVWWQCIWHMKHTSVHVPQNSYFTDVYSKDVFYPNSCLDNVNPEVWNQVLVVLRACGARIASRTEELREEDVGTGAGLFEVKKIGDEYFTFVTECKDPKACTILLRGASKEILAVRRCCGFKIMAKLLRKDRSIMQSYCWLV